ncbi:serine/threonine-protein kinase [Planctomicrobium sp. SH664]|uniref:serine/threonine-protein kinase n=1 Tax=Planctomicrobium sp. SH664 TaxID=3448125 RepID=UPI003F5C0428
MKIRPNSSCDLSVLRLSLTGELTQSQEESLAAHLAACSDCQKQQEKMAADGEWWSRISDTLRLRTKQTTTREQGSDVPTSGDPRLRLNGHDSADPESDADSHLDFAVEFLEPSPTQGALGRLGDIEILEIIDRGGMAVVLKGFQPELNRLVAVKMLAPHLGRSGAARKRFTREARAAAAILHPNVMPILTVSTTGRLPYFAMPYVDCESLQQRLDREGVLPVVDVLRLSVQLCRGLAAAHAQGLVHRDIKPGNILLERGVDRLLLTDFGLARAVDDASLTGTGMIAGTPQYMSPEQARDDLIDARSDIFSVGSVLYRMCTGRLPFRSDTTYGLLKRIVEETPHPIRDLNPEIPEWLETLVIRLHTKSPTERVQELAGFAELLEGCLSHIQQPTRFPLPDIFSGEPLHSHRGRRSMIPMTTIRQAFAPIRSIFQMRCTRRSSVVIAAVVALWGIGIYQLIAPIGFWWFALAPPKNYPPFAAGGSVDQPGREEMFGFEMVGSGMLQPPQSQSGVQARSVPVSPDDRAVSPIEFNLRLEETLQEITLLERNLGLTPAILPE